MKPWRAIGAGAASLAALQWVRTAFQATDYWIHPPRVKGTDHPTRWGLEYTDVEFSSRDGVRLRGWLFDAPGAQRKSGRPAVVVCHGYSGDKSPHINLALWFQAAGIPLLLFDFRNHGASDNGRTSIGFYERFDVLGAVDWLAARGHGRIGLHGFSMGASTALAATPLSPHVTCVVSDSAFAHLRSVLAEVVRQKLGVRVLDRLMEAMIWRLVEYRLGCELSEADPVRAARRIGQRPLLLIHGTRDEVIAPWQAQALLAAASGPAELWLVEGGQHTTIDRKYPAEYRSKVMEFFARTLAA